MASPKKRLKKVQEEVDKLQKQFSKPSKKSQKNLDQATWTIISAGLTLLALYVGILIVPGLTVAGILTGNMNIAIGMAALYGALIYVAGESGRTFSFPFALITVAIGVAGWSFLPEQVATTLSPERLLGVDIPPLNGVSFLILSLAVAAIYWAVTIRISGKAKKPEKVADRVAKKFAKTADIYLGIASVIALAALYVAYVGLANVGQLLGQVGDLLALEPFLSSNLFAVIAGYFSFGGELPIIGSVPFLQNLGADGWLFIAGGVFLVAVAAYYSTSGPTSRLFR